MVSAEDSLLWENTLGRQDPDALKPLSSIPLKIFPIVLKYVLDVLMIRNTLDDLHIFTAPLNGLLFYRLLEKNTQHYQTDSNSPT